MAINAFSLHLGEFEEHRRTDSTIVSLLRDCGPDFPGSDDVHVFGRGNVIDVGAECTKTGGGNVVTPALSPDDCSPILGIGNYAISDITFVTPTTNITPHPETLYEYQRCSVSRSAARVISPV